MALSSLYGALFPLRPCILCMTLCFLNSHLPTLPPSVSSTALCPHYRPLSPRRPSVLSPALCLLYSPLSPLWSSVPNMAFCSLYGPLKTAKLPLSFREMFYKTHFVKNPRIVAIYFVLEMIVMIAIITIITQAKYSAIIAKYVCFETKKL